MSDATGVQLRWHEEEVEGASAPRMVRVAWLVAPGGAGEPARYLAYLGDRPAVTPQLIEEVQALYPEVAIDWEALRSEVERQAGRTDVASLSDDELALRLRQLTQERDLSLTDLSLRLGYRQRNVLAEVLRFLDDPGAVARFERTAGSIFAYLDTRHPEYAFLLYKARLLFQGDEEALRRAIREEPLGFGTIAQRRLFWRAHLDAYREGLRPPAPDARTGG